MAWRDENAPKSAHYEYDYNVGEGRRVEQTRALLAEREPGGTRQYVTYMLDSDDPYSNLARSIEHSVFRDAFGNDAEVMSREYGPYEQQSRFLLSVDRDTTSPVGAMRIIEDGNNGLKSLNDFLALHPYYSLKDVEDIHGVNNFNNCWDIGTVAVLPQSRSSTGEISLQLYRGMYRTAVKEGISDFVSIVDDKACRMLTGYLNIPFVPLAGSEPFEYLGSLHSQALYGNVSEFYPKMAAKLQQMRSLGRNAMLRLVEGTHDDALQF